jgi:DNA-binding FadR family transcriptional regulator
MTKHVPFKLPRPASKSLRLHGTIARDLGIAITSGRYRPGDILTGEVAASAKLSVSRTAYREAVRILSAKGLVESRPKVGTKISPHSQWNMLDPDVLAWTFAGEPDLGLLQSLFELRDIVESNAAALAATRRTPEQLDAMHDAIGRMAHHTLATEAGRQGDMDFHAWLLRASGNPFMISLTTGVQAAVDTTNMFKQRERPFIQDAVDDHRRVLQAVADRDAMRAKEEMGALIQLALRDIAAAVKAGAKTGTAKASR